MKNKSIVLIICLFVGLGSMNAQQHERKGEGRRDFDIEKIKNEQADFFKKELNLTDAEAKAFTPLLNEFTDKKFELNRSVRKQSSELRKKSSKTEADYQRVINAYLDVKIKEAQLQKDYFQKFGTVIPAEKLYKYQRAEMKFMKRTLENRKNNDGKTRDR